jgi:hypothetical protein
LSENYEKIQDILNGQTNISDHVKAIFDGEIYSNEEIHAFLGSMYDVVSETPSMKNHIFFDFLEKDKKFEFASAQLNLMSNDLLKMDGKTRIAVSPKQSDLIEFIKRDFYCQGLSELYLYMHRMYKISHESFVAIWSIAVTTGTFADLLKQFKKEEPQPIKKRRRRK